MVINKTKGIIIAVVLLFVGYVAGAYIRVPFIDRSKLSGDIGKAKLYNKATGGFANADFEKFSNDTVYQQEMGCAVALLASRVNAADSLIGATLRVTGGIDSLSEINKQIQAFAVKTKNAKQAFADLMTTMNSVIDNGAGGKGGDNGGSGDTYEQQLNNALLAYTTVENMMTVCPTYFDTFLGGGKATSNEEMLALAGGWMKYGAEQAVFGGNNDEIAAWQSVYADVADKGGLGLLSVKSFPTNVDLGDAAEIASRNFPALRMYLLGKTAGQSALAKAGGNMKELNKIQAKETLGFLFFFFSRDKSNLNRSAGGMRGACLQRVAGATPPAANIAH